eukprot:4310295-Amphidinium_carterae.1
MSKRLVADTRLVDRAGLSKKRYLPVGCYNSPPRNTHSEHLVQTAPWVEYVPPQLSTLGAEVVSFGKALKATGQCKTICKWSAWR